MDRLTDEGQRAGIVNETVAQWWAACSRHGGVKVFYK